MKIGIIGAGNIGSALALHFRRLRHTVLIANSRGPSLLQRAKRDKAPGNRDHAAKIIARLPPDYPPQELVRVARLSAGLEALNPRSWIAALRFGFAALRAA
jgi:predicted dinucleotide-binding enzyme